MPHQAGWMPQKAQTMKLKTVEVNGQTYALVQDGKPVYEADGKDIAFDAAQALDTAKSLRGEAQRHREAKEAAEASLKAYEGISDPEAARKALQTVQSLDQKKLVDAGEIQKVRDEIAAEYRKQLAEKDEKLAKLDQTYKGEKLSAAFARSKFIAEKLAIPPDLAEAAFAKHFTFDDGGNLIAKDSQGVTITSKASGGSASFDEALEALVGSYPNRDAILKGSGAAGGGAHDARGHGTKIISQKDFDALSPKDRAAKMADGYQLAE